MFLLDCSTAHPGKNYALAEVVACDGVTAWTSAIKDAFAWAEANDPTWQLMLIGPTTKEDIRTL